MIDKDRYYPRAGDLLISKEGHWPFLILEVPASHPDYVCVLYRSEVFNVDFDVMITHVWSQQYILIGRLRDDNK